MDVDRDWRLRDQDEYLHGATLLRKKYAAWSEDWEHDHCEFCWAKFMDPELSPEHAAFISDHPEVLIEGYAVEGRRPAPGAEMGRVYADDQKTIHSKPVGVDGPGYYWVCPACVKDFTQLFEWVVVEEP